MQGLPLAVEQAIFITKFGESYFGTCYKCKKQLDCFNFSTDYEKGKVKFSKINIVCASRCRPDKPA
jgi:hypothetical protein